MRRVALLSLLGLTVLASTLFLTHRKTQSPERAFELMVACPIPADVQIMQFGSFRFFFKGMWAFHITGSPASMTTIVSGRSLQKRFGGATPADSRHLQHYLQELGCVAYGAEEGDEYYFGQSLAMIVRADKTEAFIVVSNN